MFIASFEHSVELAVLTDMHVMFILLICSFTLTSSRVQKCVGDLCSAELRDSWFTDADETASEIPLDLPHEPRDAIVLPRQQPDTS
jgi:hypothetical protein